MNLVGRFVARYLFRRFRSGAGGRRLGSRSAPRRGTIRGGRRQRGRGGFGLFGPVPYYSRRTGGGGRVAVSGCCLPLALSRLAATSVLVAVLRRRR